MRFRVVGIVGISLLLAGCADTDWDRLTSYVGAGQDDAAAARPMPQAASVPVSQDESKADDSFCEGMGESDALMAKIQGFDLAGQKQAADLAYEQCMQRTGEIVR
ncbi:MAG TPA: hypothetical protein VII56_05570 [Rhizomicrobium sp.]